MKNVLFICSQNRLRSPTAENIFSRWPGIRTNSAGLQKTAETPLTPELIEWADVVFVMEKIHKSKLSKKFRSSLANKRIICLDIPDKYEYMDPILIQLLRKKVSGFLPVR